MIHAWLQRISYNIIHSSSAHSATTEYASTIKAPATISPTSTSIKNRAYKKVLEKVEAMDEDRDEQNKQENIQLKRNEVAKSLVAGPLGRWWMYS